MHDHERKRNTWIVSGPDDSSVSMVCQLTMDTMSNTRKTQFHNKDYKADLDLTVQLNRWTLKPIGAWPNRSNKTWYDVLWCRVLNLACYGLLVFILIPGSIYIVSEIKDFYNQLKVGSALTFFMMAVIKYGTLIIREDEIRECIEHIENDWRKVRHLDDRKIMLENANFGRKLVLICGAFMYGGVIFYYMAVPLTRAKIVDAENNLTYRRLVYPVPKAIIDTRRSPVNEIFYILQLCSGFVAHNISVAVCGLAALLAMHACGQLQVLMAWLENLVEGRADENDTLEERLSNVVQQHVRVINFIALTEELLHEISLVEIVGCTLNICFLGYYAMMEWDFKHPVSGITYIVLLTSVTFNIFIFCYIGEILAEQTTKVGEKSYMIDWYRMPGKESLAVVLMMMMSHATAKITAGNLFELSISSFGDVIKTSVAYLNMLRTFTT